MTEIIIVSTRENTFKFVNEFVVSDQSFYTIDIKVEEKHYKCGETYCGKTYYDISYSYQFEGNEESRLIIHPFYNDDDEDIMYVESEGTIVYKNKMTEIMVEHLLLDSEELEKVSDLTTAQCYRTNIMLSLAKFWN